MHQSFVSTAPLGPGISGALNFSIFKAPLKALHSGAKIVVKSLLKAPLSRGLTIMKNKQWPESFELTFLAYPIVIPHKLWLHWSCSFREKNEHTHIHRHIHTFTRKPLALTLKALGIFFPDLRYWLSIFFRFCTKSVLFHGAHCMSKSILGLKRTIPDHNRCHSHQKRRKPDRNR